MADANVPMQQCECFQCKIVFWFPMSLYRQLQEQKPNKSFWCPAGHQQHYLGETVLQRERRLRQVAEQETARLADEAAVAVRARLRAEQETRRLKKRASAGTCPCCQRTFGNMARHMKSKHPTYNVVPLKAVAS